MFQHCRKTLVQQFLFYKLEHKNTIHAIPSHLDHSSINQKTEGNFCALHPRRAAGIEHLSKGLLLLSTLQAHARDLGDHKIYCANMDLQDFPLYNPLQWLCGG